MAMERTTSLEMKRLNLEFGRGREGDTQGDSWPIQSGKGHRMAAMPIASSPGLRRSLNGFDFILSVYRQRASVTTEYEDTFRRVNLSQDCKN